MLKKSIDKQLTVYDYQAISRTVDVQLHGYDFKVTVCGTGARPCLVMGIGSLCQRTLSKHFLELFTLYTFDGYWVFNETKIDSNKLSINTLCKDVLLIAQQLQLKNYFLLGHSVFGGLVMEVAKYQDKNLVGVIGIGATPGWNEQIIQFKDNYFLQYASKQRQERFDSLQHAYESFKTTQDSVGSFEAYYAESPKYFSQEISRDTLAQLWQDIHINDEIINHLFQYLLPTYDFSNNIHDVVVPVIVAGGSRDFDSVPLEIWKLYATPKKFELLDCGPVGHWPHWEAANVFDQGIEQWLKAIEER